MHARLTAHGSFVAATIPAPKISPNSLAVADLRAASAAKDSAVAVTAAPGTEFLGEIVAGQQTMTRAVRILLEVQRLGDPDGLRIVEAAIGPGDITGAVRLVIHATDAQQIDNVSAPGR